MISKEVNNMIRIEIEIELMKLKGELKLLKNKIWRLQNIYPGMTNAWEVERSAIETVTERLMNRFLLPPSERDFIRIKGRFEALKGQVEEKEQIEEKREKLMAGPPVLKSRLDSLKTSFASLNEKCKSNDDFNLDTYAVIKRIENAIGNLESTYTELTDAESLIKIEEKNLDGTEEYLKNHWEKCFKEKIPNIRNKINRKIKEIDEVIKYERESQKP